MGRSITALAIVAFLGGCGDSEASLSDTLTGSTWRTEDGFYQSYHDDGTYSVDQTSAKAEGDVASADTEWGTWALDENTITLTADAEVPWCRGSHTTGTYLLEVVDDGNRIEVTLQEDTCPPRVNDFQPFLIRAELWTPTEETTTVE